MGRRSVSSADAGRKYRLYPTPAQAERLQRWGHTCRAVWNLALEQRIYVYRQRGRCLRADEQCRYLTQARRDLDWIGELPSQALQQILRHLDRAYDNFWNMNHSARFPRFKKRSARLSIPLPGQAVRVARVNQKWALVRIPKLGEVKVRLSRVLGGEVRNATVRTDASGRWYISFAVCTRNQAAPANELPPVGVDFGVKQSAFLSDEALPRLMPPSLTVGERRRLEGLERRKARQMRHARRHRGGVYGTRLRRTLREIARIKAGQARRRLDFTHKLTTDLAKNHGLVAVEDLRVKAMTKKAEGGGDAPRCHASRKAGLNRGILDNLPGERRRQLAYKCPMYGSVLVAVEAAGTSQTCRVCHHRDPASRSDRDTFRCTNCGHVDDADHNAAAVTLHRALRTPAGAAFAAGYRGEQHAPTGRTRPVMPGSRTGRTREPLAFPIVGSEESSQATAGRMPTNIPVSS
ncbi:RNA-guided endonuclease InsQ/TnpB family protein [Streptomyces sp. NBC_01431]|uniref:RNA-guided endonuclease InsQ/TnpB family protein n=1 Tax=Streptomyces sp. NBC_01431 TaxID=2903863 RepID=UPI002E332AF9|nr:transposase [Streptomyces sp. NBC_01431]